MSKQSEQQTNVVEFTPMEFPLVEYGVTEAALAELAKRYADPDASTDDGYEHCQNGCRELTALRTGVETRRLDLKRPVVDWIRTHIDNRGKELIRRIRKIEAPVREEKERVDEIKQAEARKIAEVEQVRIDGIKAFIDKIEGTAREQAPDNTAADYQTHITWLTELTIDEEMFAEFVDDAKTARDAALFKLNRWHEQAERREADDRQRKADRVKLDKERKELDAIEKKQRREAERLAEEKREAAETKEARDREERKKIDQQERAKDAAESERVAAISVAIDLKRAIPGRAEGMGSESLDRVIIAERNDIPTEAIFQERLPEAKGVWQEAIHALQIMLKDAQESEEKARRDAEARLPDKEKLVRWRHAIIDIPEPRVLNEKAQKILGRHAIDLVKFTDRLGSDIGKL